MAFSTISLFKVNLMPGGEQGSKLKPAELQKVKNLLAIEKVESKWDTPEKAIERENEFVKKYDEDLKPRREERLANDKERMQRKSEAQQEILAKEDERAKALADARDAEFAANLK